MRELRKKIWIDSFQTRLMVRIVVYCFLYQLTSWVFIAVCEHVNGVFDVIGKSSGSAYLRTLVPVALLLPPLSLDAMRFAHRLVGPLYRFRKTIQAIAAGEPVGLVQLRKGDLLLDFRDDFNAMLKVLEQHGFILLKTGKDAQPSPEVGTTPVALESSVNARSALTRA